MTVWREKGPSPQKLKIELCKLFFQTKPEGKKDCKDREHSFLAQNLSVKSQYNYMFAWNPTTLNTGTGSGDSFWQFRL